MRLSWFNGGSMYIVIEAHDINWPVIVTDEDGQPLIFNTEQEAQEEADECQNGIVVEL